MELNGGQFTFPSRHRPESGASGFRSLGVCCISFSVRVDDVRALPESAEETQLRIRYSADRSPSTFSPADATGHCGWITTIAVIVMLVAMLLSVATPRRDSARLDRLAFVLAAIALDIP